MASDALVFNLFKNEWYELVFNETMGLLNRDTQVYLTIPALGNWKMRLIFQHNPTYIRAGQVFPEIKDGEVELKFTNWYADTWMQTTDPISLNSQDGKISTLTIIRTTANILQNHRQLTISIWKKR